MATDTTTKQNKDLTKEVEALKRRVTNCEEAIEEDALSLSQVNSTTTSLNSTRQRMLDEIHQLRNAVTELQDVVTKELQNR